jgi:hypothetical protein
MNERSKDASEKAAQPAYLNHPAFAREVFEKEKAAFRWGLRAPFYRRSFLLQLALFLVVLVLWQAPVVNPIKLLVVLFHELSHVAAAYVTGGVVFGLAIDPGGAGVTLGMGGRETIVVGAGYVGSLLIGCVLYVLSARWEPGEVWSCLCALCCASLVFGWLNDFTVVFGFGAILILLMGVGLFPERLKRFILRLVATTSCLYPVIDVAGEFLLEEPSGFVVQGKLAGSDVAVLARLLGVSKTLIAGVWMAAGIVAVVCLVEWAAKKDAEDAVKRSILDPWRRKIAPRPAFRDPLYNPNDPTNVREYRLR